MSGSGFMFYCKFICEWGKNSMKKFDAARILFPIKLKLRKQWLLLNKSNFLNDIFQFFSLKFFCYCQSSIVFGSDLMYLTNNELSSFQKLSVTSLYLTFRNYDPTLLLLWTKTVLKEPLREKIVWQRSFIFLKKFNCYYFLVWKCKNAVNFDWISLSIVGFSTSLPRPTKYHSVVSQFIRIINIVKKMLLATSIVHLNIVVQELFFN